VIEEVEMEDLAGFVPDRIRIEHFDNLIKAHKITLRPPQLDLGWRIIRSVVENKGEEILAIFARQSGKTEAIADTAFFLAITLPSVYRLSSWVDSGFRVGIFAPKKEQADICFNRLKERFDQGFAKDLLSIEVTINNGNTIKLSNGSVIHSSTGSKTATIEGYTYDLVFIEEAQDVDDVRLLKSIFPMLSATNGTRVLVGTATPERKGYFYRRLKRSRSKMVVPCTDVFPFSEKYRIYVEKEKKNLGEGSDAFRSQYLLEWPSTDSGFVQEEELYALRIGHVVKSSTERCYYGIDVGKARDLTIVTVIREDGKVLNWLELAGENYNDQKDAIVAFLKDYPNLISGYIDANGPGEPLYDFLRGADPKIRVSLSPFETNLPHKSEGYILLRQKILNREISYPSDEIVSRYKFENEMLDLEKSYQGNLMRVSGPKKGHDDYPDSCMLATMAMIQRKPTYMGYTSIKR